MTEDVKPETSQQVVAVEPESESAEGEGAAQLAATATEAPETDTSEQAASGTDLQTAAATATSEQTEAAPQTGRVVIQPGNNLWNISRVVYGRGIEYTTIYEANKKQIRNPNLIYPGQIFATPGVSPPREIDPDRRTPLAEQESASQ